MDVQDKNSIKESTTGSPPRKIAPKEKRSSSGERNRPNGGLLVFKFLVVLIVGFMGGKLAIVTDSRLDSNISTEAGERVVLQESGLISSIAENVGSSVVSITVESARQGAFGQSFEAESAGTGIIISSDGYVVTNKHVVPVNTTSVAVVMSDGTRHDDVEVIGRDPFTDIAYLKIRNVEGLNAAKLGDSSEVKVGDRVIAIGNALGEFSNTVTSGIISGLSRPLVAGDGTASGESLQNLFQTDASINPGNSGGPLVNARGEVIGINTAVAGNAENIGFSIPIDDIRGGIETVLAEGELIKPYLGIRYVTLTDELAEILGLDIAEGAYLDGSTRAGEAIIEGSPADKAGLLEGDIIVEIGGDKVTDKMTLATLAGRYKVGDVVTMRVLRGGEEIFIDVILERVPEQLFN